MKFFYVAIIVLWLCSACHSEKLLPQYLKGSLHSTSSICGGNCPSGCDTCPCGSRTSMTNIRDWCAKYHWNQQNCECIVLHESEGNKNAMHQNSEGSFDAGLWQINEANWHACNDGNPPCHATKNLNCAIDVYKWGGNTWRLWASCEVCNACNSPKK